MDPTYGEHNASEAEQAQRIVKQLPAHSIVMADSNFGIYSVAYHSTQSQHDLARNLASHRWAAPPTAAVAISAAEVTERRG